MQQRAFKTVGFMASIAILWLASCSSAPTPPVMPSLTATPGAITPYLTPSPGLLSDQATPTPPGALSAPSPTPLTYAVKAGDDMFAIAYRFGVTVEALLAANPKVNPRAMSVGMLLIIPSEGRATPTVLAPTPTPLAVSVGALTCYPTQDGGLWCFLPVQNQLKDAVENLTARVRVAGIPSKNTLEASASTLLNRLPAGASMPLVAYFPPPAPDPFQASAELLSALPVAGGDARYLNPRLENTHVDIDPGGLSARAGGAVRLEEQGSKAGAVWVVAVAYDAQGRVVGVRRWENPQPLPPGGQLSFDLTVYSLAGPIQHADLLAEARP